MILEPQQEESKFDWVQGLAGGLIGLFGLSAVLFAIFVVGRALAPPLHGPVVWKSAPGVKPDSVYAGSPVATPAPVQTEPRKGEDIIYFAPTSAVLPELVTSVQPALPKGAPGEVCESTVAVRITIDAQGTPKNPAFRHSPGCGMDLPALKAVMSWRFRPAQMDGKAVPVGAWVQVHFR